MPDGEFGIVLLAHKDGVLQPGKIGSQRIQKRKISWSVKIVSSDFLAREMGQWDLNLGIHSISVQGQSTGSPAVEYQVPLFASSGSSDDPSFILWSCRAGLFDSSGCHHSACSFYFLWV